MSFPLTQWVVAMQRWDKDRLEVRESWSQGDRACCGHMKGRDAGTEGLLWSGFFRRNAHFQFYYCFNFTAVLRTILYIQLMGLCGAALEKSLPQFSVLHTHSTPTQVISLTVASQAVRTCFFYSKFELMFDP